MMMSMIKLSPVYAGLRRCFLSVFVLTMTCSMLTGCSTDDSGAFDTVSPCLSLALRLGFPDPLTVAVTRANPVKNGITLSNVRVLQFPTAPTEVRNKLYSAETVTDWFTQETGGLITVKTGDNDFTNVDCNFYVLANVGTDFSSIGSEDILNTSSVAFSDITNEPAVLAAGPFKYQSILGATKPVALLAKLSRTYAKVSVSYTLAAGVNITSAVIENVPDKIYPFPNTSSSSTVSYLSPHPIISYPLNKDKEFTFYMPENLKGDGTANNQKEKNLAAKGPGNTLEGCTCIVLKGTYDYYPSNSSSDPIEVEYRFYLGADMVRNYDVERGKHYELTLNLKGANSADARVSVTNGNVFTFDEPGEVENEVKFE